jgi:hypothetical protein
LRLLGVDFNELIGIAKTGRAGRDPVFKNQKAAAGTGAAEHGRTYGSLMILAATSDYPGAGNAAQQFTDMVMLYPGYFFGAKTFDVAGVNKSRLRVSLAADHDFCNDVSVIGVRRAERQQHDNDYCRNAAPKIHNPHSSATILKKTNHMQNIGGLRGRE